MSKSNWMSKVVRIGAMAVGSAAFAAALMVGGRTAPATAQAAVAPRAVIQVPAELTAGPRSASCRSVDGGKCLRDGQKIHCANDRGGVSLCLCFEGEWSCQP